MELTKSFSVNIVGSDTKNPYNGAFTVKVLLTRREQFMADQMRREIIGPNAEGAMPALVGEAFMLGQLRARVLNSPKWWQDSGHGLDILDGNVISEVFELTMKMANDYNKEQNKTAEEVKAKL